MLTVADESGAILHVSLHPNRPAAEQTRAAVQRRREFSRSPTWIVRRTVGRLWDTDPDDDELARVGAPACEPAEPQASVELTPSPGRSIPAAPSSSPKFNFDVPPPWPTPRSDDK